MMEKFVEHGYLEILGIPLALFLYWYLPNDSWWQLLTNSVIIIFVCFGFYYLLDTYFKFKAKK
ncbi:DUF6007 family protein [Ligilactobacillus apodemi]|uniref:Uncharacterized protein n=1 Tax=Ligilactobacillus apodemi DSM 16634 = JCM 16172 TaxID=1423724 RepID=A0A0R1U5A9_9LACO|nr:DUF6007 family protein [Ligilactobacillus apodemi]KRL86178.1 hypothetical protein FC32_GL001889 [Ligilactobacillus apodemi DSM 16634 = JCM 16172]MCR1902003.1 DUF6007 family protein [Ligilactobacillus apodemi]